MTIRGFDFVGNTRDGALYIGDWSAVNDPSLFIEEPDLVYWCTREAKKAGGDPKRLAFMAWYKNYSSVDVQRLLRGTVVFT